MLLLSKMWQDICKISLGKSLTPHYVHTQTSDRKQNRPLMWSLLGNRRWEAPQTIESTRILFSVTLSQQLSRHQGQLRRRGKRCCRCWSRDSPAGHGDECGEAGSPPQPMEDYVGADIYAAAHEGPHAAAGGHAVKKAAAPRECTMQQVLWQELWPLEDLHWSSLFLMDYTPWKGPLLEQFLKNCIQWDSGWSTLWRGAGEEREEEGAAENWPQPAFSISPALLGAEKKVEESGVTLSQWRTGWRVVWRCFQFWFYFSVSYSIINWQYLLMQTL